MGQAEIQAICKAQEQGEILVGSNIATRTRLIRSLAAGPELANDGLSIGSRMS